MKVQQSLINEYNKIALNRNQMLHSASENSPTVTPLSAQLDDLTKSIKRAMRQAKWVWKSSVTALPNKLPCMLVR